MRGLAPKIALAAGSLALAFLGAEVGLRILGYAPMEQALGGRVRLVRQSDSPGRGYELVPGARGTGWGTEVSINSRGFRGPEPGDTGDGSIRVVALGDSITFGNDLAWNATWPAALQGELQAAGHDAEVWNLGLGGYDTMQEVATLEALALPMRPTHVILGYCVNDTGVVSMSMETPFDEEDRDNPLFLSRIAQWLHGLGVERARGRALSERNREETYARTFAQEIDTLGEIEYALVADMQAAVADAPTADRDLATRRIPPRWYASPARIGRLRHALARLAALAEQDGLDVTVLLIPYLEEDPLIEKGLEVVRSLSESFGFRVVAPREDFQREGLLQLRIRATDPVHPNARGHALLARALAGALPTLGE